MYLVVIIALNLCTIIIRECDNHLLLTKLDIVKIYVG